MLVAKRTNSLPDILKTDSNQSPCSQKMCFFTRKKADVLRVLRACPDVDKKWNRLDIIDNYDTNSIDLRAYRGCSTHSNDDHNNFNFSKSCRTSKGSNIRGGESMSSKLIFPQMGEENIRKPITPKNRSLTNINLLRKFSKPSQRSMEAPFANEKSPRSGTSYKGVNTNDAGIIGASKIYESKTDKFSNIRKLSWARPKTAPLLPNNRSKKVAMAAKPVTSDKKELRWTKRSPASRIDATETVLATHTKYCHEMMQKETSRTCKRAEIYAINQIMKKAFDNKFSMFMERKRTEQQER